jgi:KaiC
MHQRGDNPDIMPSAGKSMDEVLPITSISLDHEVSSQRISSGIPDLDAMLGGGLYRGSAMLVSGTAGTGKSSISAQFARAACDRKERVLYFAFEESPAQIVRNMQDRLVRQRGEERLQRVEEMPLCGYRHPRIVQSEESRRAVLDNPLFVRGVVVLISAAFAAALLFFFASASTRGWTGMHVSDDKEPMFRSGEVVKFPGGPADMAKLPERFPIKVTPGPNGERGSDSLPMVALQLMPLRPEEAPPPGMRPTAPPIVPAFDYTDEADPELYHEIEPREVVAGDAVWVFLASNKRALLHVRSPFHSQTGIMLFAGAAIAAFLNLIVPLFAWARNPRAEAVILFLVIGILVAVIVLSLPLALLEFFRGVALTGEDGLWIYVVAMVAFMAIEAVLLHLAYVFPHPRLAPAKRHLLLWIYAPLTVLFCGQLFAIAVEEPFAMLDARHWPTTALSVATAILLLAISAGLARRFRPFPSKRVLIAILVLFAAFLLCGEAVGAVAGDDEDTEMITMIVVIGVVILYAIVYLFSAAGLMISSYRRATMEERRRIRSAMLGMFATIAACLLLTISGHFSLQLLSFDAHIILITVLLCVLPWTLYFGVTRHHLLGISQTFTRALSTVIFVMTWIVMEVFKDASRVFVEHLLGGHHSEIVELALRLIVCLFFARISVERLLGVDAAKEEPHEIPKRDGGVDEQISAAADEVTALELAARHIAGELGARDFAVYGRTAEIGPLTLRVKSETFSGDAAAVTFRRHSKQGKIEEPDRRKLKKLGAEVTLDVAHRKERLALLVFTGVEKPEAQSPAIDSILAVLKWRLQHAPAAPLAEAVPS